VTVLKLVLVGVLLLCVLVVVLAFVAGERARQGAVGDQPRALRSIGEALRVAERHGADARVLVLFLGSDATSQVLDAAWRDDPHLLERLRAPSVQLTVLRGEPGDEVLDHLYTKYAEEARPEGPVGLVLGADGSLWGKGSPSDGPGLTALLDTAAPGPVPPQTNDAG
jgi:hypothetical protein